MSAMRTTRRKLHPAASTVEVLYQLLNICINLCMAKEEACVWVRARVLGASSPGQQSNDQYPETEMVLKLCPGLLKLF